MKENKKKRMKKMGLRAGSYGFKKFCTRVVVSEGHSTHKRLFEG